MRLDDPRFFQKRRFLIRETLIFGGVMFCGLMFLMPDAAWYVWVVTAISALAGGYFFALAMFGLFGEPLQKRREEEQRK
jgi:hypothetical protein